MNLPHISLWDEPTVEMDVMVLYVLAEASFLDIIDIPIGPDGLPEAA